MTSRLSDHSAARCKNCWPVPIGNTDNSLECADLSVRATLTIRDVNFGFFQKSIIVLKKSIFFRLSNLGVDAVYYVTCRAPPGTQ